MAKKLFKLLVKILGKRGTKQFLTKQALAAIDTNGDGKFAWDDLANGAWKNIAWGKLGFSVAVLGGLIWAGIENLPDFLAWLVEFLSAA